MKLKELLKSFKKALQNEEINEFDAQFEDHPIKNGDIYRLHFVGYYNSNLQSFDSPSKHMVDWSCKPFKLPLNMPREDAFKVISFLSDYVEAQANIRPASLESVRTVDKALSLERLGFTKFPHDIKDNYVIDLFTVGGRIRRFLSSEYYSKYFEWYTPNITLEEIQKIYHKIGLEFIPPIFNPDIQEKTKTLTK